MPSYFYHLKFELYPYPRPPDERESSTTSTKGRVKAETAWVPPPGSDIFQTRDWPQHQRIRQEDETGTQLDRKEYEYLIGRSRQGLNDAAATANRRTVIDCGNSPGSTTNASKDNSPDTSIPVHVSTPTSDLCLLDSLLVARDQHIAAQDYRFGQLRVESVDIVEMDDNSERPGVRRGKSIINTADGMSAGLAANDSPVRVTRGRFEQLEGKNTEAGWGIVHLYRDGEETPELNGSADQSYSTIASAALAEGDEEKGKAEELAEDCTTLCVPAVPTYLTYNDFLGFAGKKAIEEISHFRMVMTGRSNRYMVLMKFRSSKAARRWQAEYDGKLFIEMEPETCHVLFVKSITLQAPTTSFPELSPHDPFTPSTHLKPFPPPTHSLVELPTCPVCLERMDDTTGLLTILCQHLFHCACLQKWRGRGCPVCRFPNSPLTLPTQSPYDPDYEPPFGVGDASLCSVCDCTEDLWICLICGKTGCGRYRGGHAKDHWKESAHNFALEIETQHVWDYAEDAWVHRLIREKGDSKLIELPSSRSGLGRMGSGGHGHGEREMVPIEKLEHIGLEYTHLLTSQLESQRVYFEELVGKAVAKASAASSAASSASHRAEEAISQLNDLQLAHNHLKDEVVVNLEKDLAREKKRAEKSAELARGFGRSLTEEKEVNRGLLQRIDHVNGSMAAISKEMTALREENADLKEQNRDLLFSITASSKIQDMQEHGGELEEGEIEAGTLSLPPEKKGRGKGKAKK
ncbi:RING finger [Hyphodiscus hymeniophilus]|uniref:RING finger n=1 Tax=Hyphodiscus hymeniophilus TaxID=353542 RepID=A0A9P7AWQ9_9HELO|nr:RING finger [Hyphodiscus hymeniophilus]